MRAILERLYLGGREEARDLRQLQQHGITHVVNCAIEVPNYHPQMFTYLRMNIHDPDPTFYRHLGTVRTFIDAGRAAGGVLVHCYAGISRSPATLLGYLTYAERLNLEQAARHLGSLAWTAPDNLFLVQLSESLGEPMDPEQLERLSLILLGREPQEG
jgi:protein-tyrosine phosphatase